MKTKQLIMYILVISILFIVTYLYADYKVSLYNDSNIETIEKTDEISDMIVSLTKLKDRYNDVVVTNKVADLYLKNGDTFVKDSLVQSRVLVYLDEMDFNEKSNGYFKLKNNDYYIHYEDVDKSESRDRDRRYKNYIPFNKNVVTKDVTKLYDEDDNLIYTLNKSLNVPILVKEDTKMGVVYDDRLLYVKEIDTLEMIDSNNSDEKVDTYVPVFMYHFFYSEANGEKAKDTNYISQENFESHLEYADNAGALSLTMDELNMFLDGKINVPDKSFVISIDDGHSTAYKYAVPSLNKYNTTATLFLIGSRMSDGTNITDVNALSVLDYKNVELHSHTYDMHKGGCSENHGGLFNCISYEKGTKDLKKISDVLDGSKYFAYPFGDYNDDAIKMLDDTGYNLAFTTEYNYTSKNMNKLKLPRIRISTNTSVNTFAKHINY